MNPLAVELADDGETDCSRKRVRNKRVRVGSKRVGERQPMRPGGKGDADRIGRGPILEAVKSRGRRLVFASLFSEASSKEDVIMTFLALLELIKMRMIKVYQRAPFGPIEIIALS